MIIHTHHFNVRPTFFSVDIHTLAGLSYQTLVDTRLRNLWCQVAAINGIYY